MSTSPVAAATRTPSLHVPASGPLSPNNDAFFKILAQLGKKSPTSNLPQRTASPAASTPGVPPPARACRKPDEEDLEQGSPERKGRPQADPDKDSAASDLLDPMTRQLGAPIFVNCPSLPEVAAVEPQRVLQARAASLEHLFGVLVRRACWSLGSDRRSATLRLEIGTGALEGSSIIISADPHQLQIVLDSPPGVDMEAWKNRLRRRLASQGLEATFV
jgi:hypothetical protein